MYVFAMDHICKDKRKERKEGRKLERVHNTAVLL